MKKAHVCLLLTSYIKDNSDMIAEIEKNLPGARVSVIADSDLLSDIRAAGHVPEHVMKRMSYMAMSAEAMGADIIYNTCSSVGEVADVYSKLVNIPVVKIDEAMAEEVAKRGGRVTVVATVESTLPPSKRLIERKAAEYGTSVDVKTVCVSGAYEKLRAGDRDAHNTMVLKAIRDAEKDSDAVAMAQVSMRALLPELESISIPVYCSFHSGAERLAKAWTERYGER